MSLNIYTDPLTLVQNTLSTLKSNHENLTTSTTQLNLEKTQILHVLQVLTSQVSMKDFGIMKKRKELEAFDVAIGGMEEAFFGINVSVGKVVEQGRGLKGFEGEESDYDEDDDDEEEEELDNGNVNTSGGGGGGRGGANTSANASGVFDKQRAYNINYNSNRSGNVSNNNSSSSSSREGAKGFTRDTGVYDHNESDGEGGSDDGNE